jgi:hypothetical protein
MEREGKQQSSKGSGVGVGIACSVIGAIIGAVGYHIWTKQEEVTPHSHSEYVTIQQLIFCVFLCFMMERLGIFFTVCFIGSLFHKHV